MSDGSCIIGRYRTALRLSPKNYAAQTVAQYVSLASRYVSDVDDWRTATVFDVEEWLAGLERGVSGTRDAWSAVRRFYRWALRCGEISHNPASDVELPRMPRRRPRPMMTGDVALAVIGSTGQIRGMVALMAGAGLRCCEVAALQWSDIDTAERTVFVRGKGGHERIVPLPPAVLSALPLDAAAGRYVFVSETTGNRYTAARLSQIVNQHLRAMGITATAHQFRHWYATERLRVTGSLPVVRDLLGHASVSMTETYAASVRPVFDEYPPANVPGL